MKDNDIIITGTGALGIVKDGEIVTPDGDHLDPAAAEFALRMLPEDPDTLEIEQPASGIVFPETQIGSKGLTVVLLQTALKCRGFDPGTIDGDFGTQTHRALHDYMKAEGIPGDTVATMSVYKKLFEEQEK